MILAVDVGNSRIKWGLHDGVAWLRQGVADHAEFAQLAGIWAAQPVRQIVYSHVAGILLEGRLTDALRLLGVSPQRVVAQSFQCGVRNGYAPPEQLGSDRWAALIAARRRCGGACVVVNAGTAMTVDALSGEGVFLGGLIVPGYATMRRALASDAAALTLAEGQFQIFPANTADALHSGALAALSGAVAHLMSELSSLSGETPACLVSGGDAALLLPQLPTSATKVDNLVLEGLIEIARECPSV